MRGVVDALVGLVLVHLRKPQRKGDVLAHGQVRVERVVLEDHREVAVLRAGLVDALAADGQIAGADVLQADDHPQQRGLPAAGRPDEDDELAVGDVQVDVVHRDGAVGIPLGDTLEHDFRHVLGQPFTAPEVRPATMRRWKINTMMMMGMVTTIAAAAIAPVGCENWTSR